MLVTYVYIYSTCSYTYTMKTAGMDSTSRPSSESAEIRANRLLHRRERERALRASESAEQREERLRKRRIRDRAKRATKTACRFLLCTSSVCSWGWWSYSATFRLSLWFRLLSISGILTSSSVRMLSTGPLVTSVGRNLTMQTYLLCGRKSASLAAEKGKTDNRDRRAERGQATEGGHHS